MRGSVKGFVTLGATAALLVSTVGVARADVLTNNVGGSGQVVTVAPGGTAIVAFRINATSTPAGDPAGCDASGGVDKSTITVSSTSGYTNLKLKGQGGATAGAVSLDATNCRQSKKFQFIVAPGTPGGTTWSIVAAGSGGIAGSAYTSSGDFTLRVSATAAATNLVLAPASANVVYGTATQAWTATLTTASGGAPVGGKVINFNVGGVSQTATTNASGVATLVAPIGTTYDADTVPYDIDAAFNGDTSYASSTAAGTFTITKANQAALTITSPTSGSAGQTLPIQTSGGSGTGALSFGASGACSLDSAGTSVVITSGTGTCTVTASKAGDTNYNATSATPVSFSPGKAAQASLSVDSPSSASYGDVLDIVTSGGSGSGAVTVSAGSSTACTVPTSGANNGKLVVTSGTGSCELTATKAADSFYSATTSAPHTVTIGKAAQSLTITGPATGTYGSTQPITYNDGAGTGAVTFDTSAATDACTVSGSDVTITKGTGTCGLVAHKAADANYGAATSPTFSVTPDKADATLQVSGLNPTYDGNEQPVTVTTDPAGLTGVTVTYDGSTTAPTHAGTYAVVASLLNDNYVADSVTDTLVISPKTLTASVAATGKEYDGNTDASATASLPTGVVAGDTVGVQVDSASFDTASAGSPKTVTVHISLTGSSAGDYDLANTAPTTTAGITPRALTASITADGKEYDGNASALANSVHVTLDRVVGLDDVTASVVSASFDSPEAGNRTVTATLALTGADRDNYALTSSTATANSTIDPKALTASITAEDKDYDGTTAATVHGTLQGVVGTDNVAASPYDAVFEDANAGTGKTVTAQLQLTGAKAGDYTLHAGPYGTTATIRPLTLTVTASSASVTKGSPVPAITPSYAGWLTGEGPSVLITAPTCSTTYTPASDVGTYPTSCSGLVAHNYVPSYVNGSVTVTYPFNGFFQPVDNLPAVNRVKAGSAIPVKFSLGGNQGLDIFRAGSPTSATVSCGANAPDDIEATVTAGGSSLTYDATANQYVYVWKTDSKWAGTCRQLVIVFKDGTTQRANFTFSK